MAAISLEQANQRLRDNNFSDWLGIEAVEFDGDTVRFVMPFRPEIIGSPDTLALHGGVSAAIIDNACAVAHAMRAGKFCPTINLQVDFHRPAREADGIQGWARVIKYGSKVSTAEATLEDKQGKVLSSGRATFYTGFEPQVAIAKRDAGA